MNPRYYRLRRLSPVWQPIARWVAVIGASLALTATFMLAGLGDHLFETPNPEKFMAVFFKEPFVVLVASLIGWYVSSLKSSPSRMHEYALLNSLPIQGQRVCYHFLIQDLREYSWAPALHMVLYLGLLPVSPLPFLLRLGLLSGLTFCLVVTVGMTFHIRTSVRGRANLKYPYPISRNPLIQVVIILAYVFLLLLFVIQPNTVSGYSFWLVFTLLAAGSCVCLVYARAAFAQWQNVNAAFSVSSASSRRHRSTRLEIPDLFRRFPRTNPLLLKNLLKLQREKSALSFVLTLGFIMLAYLVSMNNESIEDVTSVLFAITCIYALLSAYRAINYFSPEEESPKLIHSLPVRKMDFHFSVFLPAVVWLALVATLLAILLLFSGARASTVGLFWLRSGLTSAAIVLVACTYALGAYPGLKRSQRNFLYWTLATIILTAAFYPYRFLVLGLMLFVPFLQVRKAIFYKIA